MLSSLILQNFRNHQKLEINFPEGLAVIVGPNGSGKTNILEAIKMLSSGRDFRGAKDSEIARFGENWFRASAEISQIRQIGPIRPICLVEIVWHQGTKRCLVNGLGKHRVGFIGQLNAVLFPPEDLDLITDSPSRRRQFLDDILEVSDKDYYRASLIYTKALRQRNRLLEQSREIIIPEQQFAYWDEILISQGQIITQKRRQLLDFFNQAAVDFGQFRINYDSSIISHERLQKYFLQERASGQTLVGPQRDDFVVLGRLGNLSDLSDLKHFGSRGQQRLGVLWLKTCEMSWLEKTSNCRPLLLLDDIFSELDVENQLLLSRIFPLQQTILTTTDQQIARKFSQAKIFALLI